MYTDHFGLSRRPFGATPDPACCYLGGASFTNVLADVVRCLESDSGLGVVTGEAGTGKSLLCQYLGTELQDRFETVVISSCNFPTRRSLLQSVLFELKQPFFGKTDLELRLELTECLKGLLQETGHATLLILDEAHLLSDRLLEEIRTLADLSEAGKGLFRMLLAGQPGLEERLAQPGHDAFNQRIGTQVTLEALSRAETADYIAYRLKGAGGEIGRIFSPEAVRLIAQACDGLPRQINQLCDHALMLTYVDQSAQVDVETVRQALEDLQRLPLHWNPTAMLGGPLDRLEREEELIDIEELEAEQNTEDEMLCDDADSPEGAFEFGADLDEPAQIVGESSEVWEPESETTLEWDAELPEVIEAETAGMIEAEPPVILEAETPFVFEAETPTLESTFPVEMNSVLHAEELPPEERVEDRYAALDAGRKFFTRKKETEEVVNEAPVTPEPPVAKPPHSVLRGPMSSAFFEHASITPPSATPERTDPLQFLDEVVIPMLNRSLEQELPTRSELDRRLEEFIAAQKSAEPGVKRFNDLEIEDQVGEDVLELCLETQREVLNVEEFPGEAEQVLGPGFFETSTEEVPPTLEGFGPVMRGDEGHAEVPKPNYKTVFSELRRRLKQKRML